MIFLGNNGTTLQSPVILDGATGTNLISAGLPEGVCVEQWILENPECIEKIQREFINYGSDIIYAPTFSANSEKLASYGLEDDIVRINSGLVEISKQNAGGHALVAGDISPTGRFLTPYGDMEFFDMFAVFYRQAKALYDAKVDLFVIETMHSLAEARAAVLACKRFDIPIFVTITVDESGRTLTGASALSSLICIQELGVTAFGLNCSSGPEFMRDIISEIAPFAKIPLIAKPNAGQPDENGNYSLTPEKMALQVAELVNSGASIVGGCCGTTPMHIKAIAEKCKGLKIKKSYNDELNNMLVLSNETQAFFLSPDSIEISDYIKCSQDMSDILIDFDNTSVDIIGIEIFTHDDAMLFAENVHMSPLPVIFKSANASALEAALILYPGRACIDSRSELPEDTLRGLANKYGAIVY